MRRGPPRCRRREAFDGQAIRVPPERALARGPLAGHEPHLLQRIQRPSDRRAAQARTLLQRREAERLAGRVAGRVGGVNDRKQNQQLAAVLEPALHGLIPLIARQCVGLFVRDPPRSSAHAARALPRDGGGRGATHEYSAPPSPCRPGLAIDFTLATVSFPMSAFSFPRVFSNVLSGDL